MLYSLSYGRVAKQVLPTQIYVPILHTQLRPQQARGRPHDGMVNRISNSNETDSAIIRERRWGLVYLTA
jgi:hypothetical protein